MFVVRLPEKYGNIIPTKKFHEDKVDDICVVVVLVVKDES